MVIAQAETVTTENKTILSLGAEKWLEYWKNIW